jgi:hypothetical protein
MFAPDTAAVTAAEEYYTIRNFIVSNFTIYYCGNEINEVEIGEEYSTHRSTQHFGRRI